ncbi:MAG TPA: cytochrome c oxidase accessory protein CcoG [Steroidobacteraceae bacterium]
MNAETATGAAATSETLYVAHEKLYPREVGGRFQRLRVATVLLLLGLFYALPWIPWEGRQAVLFDLPARKFYILGLVFWPQDFFLLSWLLIIAALSLFFVTALAGRLWCGYACPQTVWTEVFVWMERLVEGNRSQRIKLDRAPLTAAKLLRKSAKQALWIGFSAWTGFTFVGLFTPIDLLARELASLTLGPWELFWIVFYGFATYGNAGYLREQVCEYMCPYARFQSAMFDRDTLIISYDERRGEPRGRRPRGIDHRARNLGDCIDCTLCVQVCPTGIDIRKGLQYECIACAACIDACDEVMDRMAYPRGLIRYATEASMRGESARILRPRTAIYATLLGALVAGFVAAVVLRNPLGIDVIRDRNALFRMLEDGTIENVYIVRLLNKDQREHRLRLSVEGNPALHLDTDATDRLVAAGEVATMAVRLRLSAGPAGGQDVTLRATAVDDDDDDDDDEAHLTATAVTRFIAPPR